MVHCPKCRALNYDKRVLCAECGTKLNKPTKVGIPGKPVNGIYRGRFTS